MKSNLVISVKRENGKIIGVLVIPEDFEHQIRMYIEISHVYYEAHTQIDSRYYVEYIKDEKTMLKGRFRLKVQKTNNGFEVVEPLDPQQLKALKELPEYIHNSNDFM